MPYACDDKIGYLTFKVEKLLLENKELAEELNRYRKSFDGHVYITNEEWAEKGDAIRALSSIVSTEVNECDVCTSQSPSDCIFHERHRAALKKVKI